MALTRDDVLAAALGIVDEYGLADLTMRRLAAQLDVQAGALYYHVANKQTLLVALADLVLADLPDVDGHTDPVEWGMALYAVLRRHRSGAELVSAALAMRPRSESPATALAPRLVAVVGTMPPAVARGVVSLVLGHTLDEEQREQFARLGAGLGEGAPAGGAAQGADDLRVALVRLMSGGPVSAASGSGD